MGRRALAAGAAMVSTGLAVAMISVTPALAGPASVKGLTTHIVIAPATVLGNDTTYVEATCGAGELLVGGGYVVNSTATDFRMYVDAPLNTSSWLVEPINFDANPLNFSAYAICAMSAPGGNAITAYSASLVQAHVDVPALMTGNAQATCPAGELRTGGGYQVYNISNTWSVYTNGPFGTDSWIVNIDNEDTTDTQMDAFAICLGRANSKPITGLAVSTVDTHATVQGMSTQTADVSCPPQSLMTGGGHEMDSIGQSWSIQASAPVSSNDWQVLAASLDSNSRDFDSLAVCLAKA